MNSKDEIAYLSASELAFRIRRRDLSPVDVVDSVIKRIEQRNESLNAFVYKGFEDARAAAQSAEKQLYAGDAIGPLHGVPIAIKDLFDFKPGWPATMGGIRALKEFITDFHCAFAARMESAGAIIIGKTNSPTMGLRGTCDNFLFGPSCNPFDTSKNTGGSSGGSAAAVADGLVPLAEGTDAGGSIRIPAAWCNVYGYKASFGRTPLHLRPNAFSAINPFVHEGPITRTVDDAALALSVLSGYDSADPFSFDDKTDLLSATRRSIRGWKIAYSPDFDVFPVDERVSAVVEKAVRAFEEAGASVKQVKLGIKRSQRELSDLWCRIITTLNVEALDGLKHAGIDLLKDHRDDFPPEYLKWVDAGPEMKMRDISQDQTVRTEIYDAVQSVFNDYDLLITPTLACLPVDNADDGNTKGPTKINGEDVDPLIGWCLTYPINFTGHPAASIPAGLVEGLPVGMQIIGRSNADGDVLAASAAFERLRPWHSHYQICRDRAV